MASENVVTLVGNLADDPQLRETTAKVPVASFSVAVNRRFYDQEKQVWDERLDGFFPCTAWRDQAVHVAKSLHKGDRVHVTGRLRRRTYEVDGQQRWTTEVEVEEVSASLRFATMDPQRQRKIEPTALPEGVEDPTPVDLEAIASLTAVEPAEEALGAPL
jgi:single-strand DNA-binding protein